MAVQPGSGARFDGVEQLLGCIQRGNNSQLGALLDLYRGFLLDSVGAKLSPDLAVKASESDLVQEALIDAARGFSEFRGTTEPQLRAWLQQILSRKMVDAFRDYRRSLKRNVAREVSMGCDETALEIPVDVRSPLNELVTAEKHEHLAWALQQLNVDDRQVIELRTFKRLSFEEVGQQIGKRSDAARKHWYFAVRRLRDAIRELRHNDSSFT
jgi:RNA polymerase sigma-70 factor (ECF subfamily)